jgi:hypothetical protein
MQDDAIRLGVHFDFGSQVIHTTHKGMARQVNFFALARLDVNCSLAMTHPHLQTLTDRDRPQ